MTFTFSQAGRAEASSLSFGPAKADWDNGGGSSLTSAVVIVDSSGNLIASADFAPVSLKSGGNLTFPTGGLFMQHQPVAGGAFSPLVEDALAKAWLGGSQLPVWNLYLALSTGVANVAIAPSEPSDPGYARLAAPPSVWNSATAVKATTSARTFASGLDNSMSYDIAVVTNKQVLNFPAPTMDWGTVQSVYLMDAATGGNVLAAANLILPRSVNAGDPAPGFDLGAFRINRS